MSEEETRQQPGLVGRISKNIEMAKKGYEQLVHAIIRPPRARYSLEQLGPKEFTFLSKRFRRDDIEIITEPRKLKLKASLWTQDISDKNDEATTKTLVVYLHGNASARVEVLPQLSFLLSQNIFGVCSCDFTGSGKSDGDYVSLGYYERYDLECLLQHLQELHGDIEIVLWGRSMGASTALMHVSELTQSSIEREDGDHPDTTSMVKGVICDSPFCSLLVLCEELVERAREQGIVVPGVIVSAAIAMIARSVNKLAQFSIYDIVPLDHTPTIGVPALFVVGADDDFIPPHHSEALVETYQQGISTNLLMVPGGHNDSRPEIVFESIEQFLKYRFESLTEPPLKVPKEMKASYYRNPPWAYFRYSSIFQAHTPSTTQTAAADTKTNTKNTENITKPEEEELGMTQERQDDIQNKVNMMLGGVGTEEKKENSTLDRE